VNIDCATALTHPIQGVQRSPVTDTNAHQVPGSGRLSSVMLAQAGLLRTKRNVFSAQRRRCSVQV
jgi:hypothetical protein